MSLSTVTGWSDMNITASMAFLMSVGSNLVLSGVVGYDDVARVGLLRDPDVLGPRELEYGEEGQHEVELRRAVVEEFGELQGVPLPEPRHYLVYFLFEGYALDLVDYLL